MKLILQKNAKISSGGGSAPRPPQKALPIANFWLRAWLWGSRPALAHISRLRPTRPLREGVPKLCAPIPNCQTRTRKVVHQII